MSYAGFDDWRLADLNGLSKLVLLAQDPVAPTIDRDAFPGTDSGVYWTNEETVPGGESLGVDFATGNFFALTLSESGEYRVRCVR